MKHTKQIRKMSAPKEKKPLFLHYKELGTPHDHRVAIHPWRFGAPGKNLLVRLTYSAY